MNPHLPMVLINGAISVGVIIALTFLIKVFHLKIKPIWLLLIVTLLPLVSMLRPGVYESGDFSLHAMRAMSFYDAISSTHTLPRWTAELNYGYGDAFFEFIYVVPYIVISLFHVLGLSFIASVKLLLATTYVASGVFMFYWIRDDYGENAALISAIFYLFAPYHLVDMHFRVTIAESMSFLFLPLIFWMVERYLNSLKKRYLYVLTLGYALLLLTHSVIFTAITPVLVVYAWLCWKRKKGHQVSELVNLCVALAASVLLCTFYWLPILAEKQYLYDAKTFAIEFHPAWMNFISPWRFGLLFQGHQGELSYIIGYTQLLVVALAGYFIAQKKYSGRDRTLVLFFLIATLICFIMMRSFTYPIWVHLPLVNNIQYTYRLLELIVFFIAALAGMTLMHIKNAKIIIAVVVVTIFYTILNWGNRATIPNINDAYLKNQLLHGPLLTGRPEPTTPIWVDKRKVPFVDRPSAPMVVLYGTASIMNMTRTAIEHDYVVRGVTNVVVRENTFYFPGWTVFVDTTPVSINYKTNLAPGILIFSIPRGTHVVRVVFLDTPVRAFADKVSEEFFALVLIATLFTGMQTLSNRQYDMQKMVLKGRTHAAKH